MKHPWDQKLKETRIESTKLKVMYVTMWILKWKLRRN